MHSKNTNTIKAVHRIFELLNDGMTSKGIARTLNSEGYKTARGLIFDHNRVTNLRHRIQVGEFDSVLKSNIKLKPMVFDSLVPEPHEDEYLCYELKSVYTSNLPDDLKHKYINKALASYVNV